MCVCVRHCVCVTLCVCLQALRRSLHLNTFELLILRVCKRHKVLLPTTRERERNRQTETDRQRERDRERETSADFCFSFPFFPPFEPHTPSVLFCLLFCFSFLFSCLSPITVTSRFHRPSKFQEICKRCSRSLTLNQTHRHMKIVLL